jgi:hypothetical protein
MARRGLAIAIFGLLLVAAPAAAQRTLFGGALTCVQEADHDVCRGGFVRSWDGAPLSVDVYLPPGRSTGLPLVALLTGYPGYKPQPDGNWIWPSPAAWTRRGYAVVTLAPRGMTASCGPAVALEQPEVCDGVESHLADSRYEARDVQHLAGVLADEGVAEPAIGVVGESYGGGTALQLAVLADRVHLPDGTFAPWRSPGGLRMRVAAAAPLTTWSDLAYSLVKNGRARDDRNPPGATGTGPIGVPLASFFTGFTALGVPDVSNDLTSQSSLARWWAAMQAGEPFTPAARAAMDDFATFHSANGIQLAGRPAPTLLAGSLTDDLFPVQEALRHVNRVKAIPGVRLAQVHGEFGGHGRTLHDPAHAAILRSRVAAFVDHHVRGIEDPAPAGVEVLVPTCGEWSGDSVAGRTWAGLSTGTVSVRSAALQIVSAGGSPLLGRALDPVAVGEPRCAPQDAADQAGVATYRSPPAGSHGLFLLGSPEVSAALTVIGAPAEHAQLAARLWDVDPAAGTQLLVSRTLYRPSGGATETFQLHGTAYRFPPGHVAKLELLTHDAPYGRPSNLPFAVHVTGLELRLPVR